jgi:hypothetical protein
VAIRRTAGTQLQIAVFCRETNLKRHFGIIRVKELDR